MMDRERIAEVAATRLGTTPGQVRVEPLSGRPGRPAGSRASSPTGRSLLVLELPAPETGAPAAAGSSDAPGRGAGVAAEAPTRAAEPAPLGATTSPEASPYLDVRRYLSEVGARVPAVLEVLPQDGLVLLEDLGERTVAVAIEEAGRSPLLRDELLGAAVNDLAYLRRQGEARPDPACVAFRRSLQADRLRRGLDRFLEASVAARGGTEPDPTELAELRAGFDALAARIAKLPQGLTLGHFDADGLLLSGPELVLVGLADALQGPLVYDLATLVRDPKLPLPREAVDWMVERYLDGYRALGGRPPEREELDVQLDLVVLQQSLERAGSLLLEDPTGGSPLRPRALGFAREALSRLPEYASLWEVLARHAPELAPEEMP